ncbi:MAG: LysR substrate-binding domain-containing protein [Pseudomonadota bacterium]
MKDLPLNALRALAAAYETGGIRPAGRRLGVTHSAVSRHLSDLEKLLGVPLFQKTGASAPLAFTPQGEMLGKSALSCLSELDKSVTAVREARQGNSVVVATTPSFAVRWLLPRLPAFEQRHPSIEVSLLVDQRTRSPGEDNADLAIRMGRRPRGEDACEALMDDALFPVASPAYLAEHGAKLESARLLHDRDPATHWDAWRRAHGPQHLDTRKGSRYSSSDLVLKAAEQGMGVALARGRLAAASLKAGMLVRMVPEFEVQVKSAYWLIPAPQALARHAVQELVNWLRAEATVK